ncbi:protein-serine O-palmitoleoyltransferase porcupine [Lutzomyia longipalpis]|uniref:protein-serine O-palmitoleoyltransferase porcupine n=1 Tax=Lutzomyia longipalpis TaxID=7200 RepID=UPI0024840769|nr:protein-serine O-palmitoleoyltransferase porcupine [Lutzomyia longipalpis]
MDDFLYDDYYVQDDVEEFESSSPFIWHLDGMVEGCVVPVGLQMGSAVGIILVTCALQRLISSFVSSGTFRNVLSISFGCLLLGIIVGINGAFVVALAILHIFLLHLVPPKVHVALALGTPIVVELVDPNVERWQQIRGVNMGIAMKGISLAFDGVQSNWLTNLGYFLDPPTVIFGPWRSLDHYRAPSPPFLPRDAVSCLWTLLIATGTFLTSNCLLATLTTPWRWLEAYRDALSFRLGHYFVNYVASASLIVATSDHRPIVRPLKVEAPRSLVEVVVAWNLPMHAWLKRYIFQPFRRCGPACAIAATYAASALLHGLSPPLVAVLMHLAIVTWVEFQLRHKVASVFSACVAARRCSGCRHMHRGFLVIFLNLLFGFVAVLQLAYLGALFDGAPQQTITAAMTAVWDKWSHLGFVGHWLLAGALLLHVAS